MKIIIQTYLILVYQFLSLKWTKKVENQCYLR